MADIIAAARNLASEEGENPEYDRALTELVCDVLGFHMDNKPEVAHLIGIHPKSVEAWGYPADLAAKSVEFTEAFAALRASGLEHDADDPIAARYRAASDAVNHAHRRKESQR